MGTFKDVENHFYERWEKAFQGIILIFAVIHMYIDTYAWHPMIP